MAIGGHMFRAMRHHDFRLYAAGMAVSLAGTWMQNMAQAWLVYRLTRSEWMLGLTWFCASVPVLLLSPIAGAMADRWPRRRIVMATQTAGMVQASILAALTLSGRIEIWHVLVLSSVLGISTAFDIPSRQALFIHLVGKDDLLNAISLNSATFNAARIIGPSLGGFIIARWGEGPCFLINALSYIAVLISLAAMRVREQPHEQTESPLEALKSGFAFVRRTPEAGALLALCGLISIAASPGSTLAPVFAEGIFKKGALGLGMLSAGMGVGAILGTLSLARRRVSKGLPRVILGSTAMLGVAMAIYAVSPSFWLCLAMMPLIGMSVMRHSASANTTIQMSIPDAYRGRVMGLYSMMVIGMTPIGSLLSGALAEAFGSRVTMMVGAAGCLAAAGVARWWSARWESWLQR
jgi:MFS family permease